MPSQSDHESMHVEHCPEMQLLVLDAITMSRDYSLMLSKFELLIQKWAKNGGLCLLSEKPVCAIKDQPWSLWISLKYELVEPRMETHEQPMQSFLLEDSTCIIYEHETAYGSRVRRTSSNSAFCRLHLKGLWVGGRGGKGLYSTAFDPLFQLGIQLRSAQIKYRKHLIKQTVLLPFLRPYSFRKMKIITIPTAFALIAAVTHAAPSAAQALESRQGGYPYGPPALCTFYGAIDVEYTLSVPRDGHQYTTSMYHLYLTQVHESWSQDTTTDFMLVCTSK